MPDEHTAFVGSIPEKYDRYLGPLLFHPYASDLVGRLPISAGMSVLEVACGTGIATRLLRDRLPSDARVIATDLNQMMIDCARRKFSQDEAIEWKQADAAALPFQNESFDAVVCQFGLMFLPDKEAGLREAYRVLAPGGAFLFNVWDAIEHNELARLAHETIKSFFENDPPLFYEVPFGFHDAAKIEASLRKVGFRDLEMSVVSKTGIGTSAMEAAIGLVEGNPVVGQIVERNASAVPVIVEALATAISGRFGGGPIEGRTQALVWQAAR